MKPKPTRSAAPRLLPNGQPDQSNIICSEQASRLIAAAIARGCQPSRGGNGSGQDALHHPRPG